MIKALLVDDEEKSRKDLRRLLELYCKDVSVIGEVSSMETAIKSLEAAEPELLFLDIEMGDGSGFNLLKYNAKNPFQVIFVTAHAHYALKAFRYAALDYLLKPIDVDDLVAAVDKAKHVSHVTAKVQLANHDQYLELRISNGILYVNFNDIIRLQAEGSYTIVYLTNGEKHYLSYHIGYFETRLQDARFFRVHKSHLVNLQHVKKFLRMDGYCIEMTDASKVEVSRRHKTEFLRMLNGIKSFNG